MTGPLATECHWQPTNQRSGPKACSLQGLRSDISADAISHTGPAINAVTQRVQAADRVEAATCTFLLCGRRRIVRTPLPSSRQSLFLFFGNSSLFFSLIIIIIIIKIAHAVTHFTSTPRCAVMENVEQGGPLASRSPKRERWRVKEGERCGQVTKQMFTVFLRMICSPSQY